MPVTKRRLAAFRELAAAGVMESVPGADGNLEADFRFAEEGWAKREEILREAEERNERGRFDPPDASNLSESARAPLRRILAGERVEVDDVTRA